MAKRAREDLNARIEVLMAAERSRYDEVTAQLTAGTTSQELVQSALSAQRDVRRQTEV